MPGIPYINYKDLAEFYTINALCSLLELDKAALRRSANSTASSRGATRSATTALSNTTSQAA